jgi:hypothetical protein
MLQVNNISSDSKKEQDSVRIVTGKDEISIIKQSDGNYEGAP